MTRTSLENRKAAVLLELAMELQSRSEGMTIQDIAQFVGSSRRTAERYRDELWRLFPNMRAEIRDDGLKTWKLPANRFLSRMSPSAEELAQLRSAANLYRENGLQAEAGELESLYRKISAASAPSYWARLDPDIEALLEADGLATHQGPRRQSDPEILLQLRQAILAQKRVILHYFRRDIRRKSKPLICPYGFLLGRRQYLVAYNMHPNVQEIRTYVLANIEKVDIQQKSFEVKPEFDLKTFAARSFGSWYDDKTIDAVWRFSANAVDDVKSFVFHPSQKFDEQEDGSLIVRFSACGTLEMCWHLFTWGTEVEVLKPESLRNQYAEFLETVSEVYRDTQEFQG
jgi:predicted DNA-binding transcriptional regulator YafY